LFSENLMQRAGVEALFQHEDHERREDHEGRAMRAWQSSGAYEVGCAPMGRAFVCLASFVIFV
jgi:hypothetical protein